MKDRIEHSHAQESRHGHILVVDDEPQLLEYLGFILEKNGYQTTSATSATEALKIIADNHIDVLISDVVMPGMNGFELYQRVQERYPHIQVQLVSGFAGMINSSLVPKHVLDALIEKPYDEATLINRIEQLLAVAPEQS